MKKIIAFFLLTATPIFPLLSTSVVNAKEVYDAGLALTLESISNLDGGIKKGSSQLANIDVTLGIDTEAAGWWDKGEWFIYVLGNTGDNPAEKIGELQAISNIATDESLKVYEFWYQHSFAAEKFKVLFGLHDYNSTFYSLEAAGLFAHSSFGIGPDTSQVGPSIFSTTSVALHFSFASEKNYLLAAVYDGVPGDPDNPRGTHIKFNEGDGTFSAIEWGMTEEGSYKIGLGLWQHTAEVENPVDANESDKNNGIYFIAEKTFAHHLSAFLQLGQADDDKNQIGRYLGIGVVRNQLFNEEDTLGLAVAHARNGNPYVDNNPDILSAETAWELSYATPVADHFSIQPSVYFIENPSMDPLLDNVIALGIRIGIAY
jgi:porin